eukprot:781849-Amphidinium_carterae.1
MVVALQEKPLVVATCLVTPHAIMRSQLKGPKHGQRLLLPKSRHRGSCSWVTPAGVPEANVEACFLPTALAANGESPPL